MARSSSRPSRTYPSKIDAGIGALLGLAVVAIIFVPVMAWFESGSSRALLVGLATAPAAGLVVWILLSTHYTLEGRALIVRSGPFRWRIDIESISNVAPVRGISMRVRTSRSSPALSMGRLEITYGAGKRLTISPAQQDAFLKDLASRGVGT